LGVEHKGRQASGTGRTGTFTKVVAQLAKTESVRKKGGKEEGVEGEEEELLRDAYNAGFYVVLVEAGVLKLWNVGKGKREGGSETTMVQRNESFE